MPIKIRLQRHGRKGVPFYHIVVTDSRSPRNGKFIKNLGIYNPLTKTIKMSINSTVFWLDKGAQPTNTARFLLSKIGLLYKKHLLLGIRKGAFDNIEAENRFNEWIKKNKNVNVNKNILIYMKK